MTHRVTTLFLLFLALNTGWFVVYSASLGLGGLLSDRPAAVSRVFLGATPLANVALALHMLAGAILTVGAPLQALPILRRRWPGAHRRFGYTLFTLAGITGLGGLVYIGLRGTVGGPWMSLWFALYGIALMGAAGNTVYHALNKDLRRHVEWATRFVILAVGSWIYRMHYAIWVALTDGAGSNEAFTGPFDRITVVAFFVPYLSIAEVLLRRTRRRRPAAG
jgi:hypothetical protein